MDHEINALERMLLDESAEPTDLPFSLLQDITNCFSDDRRIGSGGFAVVYKGMTRHGMVAVKKLSKLFDIEEKKFHKEVECLVKAKHKNIVRFLGYCAETQGKIADYEGKFVIADTRNWLLCFEYVPNGSLDKYIADPFHGIEWRERFEIIKAICEGLHYLHGKRILHLDLKPENILIDDHMVPKIADFGLSRCLSEEQTQVFTTHLCGSCGYLAPEFFSGQLTFASDIYSLGVVIMEILTGKKGYPEDENVVENWRNRLEGGMQLEQVSVCTHIGIECMEPNPKKRPAVRHIVDRLAEIASIVQTDITAASVEQQVSFEQHRIVSTSTNEIEDGAQRLQRLQNDQCQEKEDQWSIRGLQDTNQDPKYTGISSSNSGVSEKLRNLNILNRNPHTDFVRNGGSTMQQPNSLKIFLEEELKPILHTDNLIGENENGVVYRGQLIDGTDVAIKKLRNGMGQAEKEFRVEVEDIGHVRHENIVCLLGYCVEGIHRILVYEYVNNGNLEQWMHGAMRQHGVLTWKARMKIVLGIARALAYLHEAIEPKVVHRDIKASSILIDEDFNGKLSNFGLAKLLGAGKSHITTRVMGTFGYVAPEYANSGLLNEQSDVYSFGVLLLEVLTGRDPIDYDQPANITIKSYIYCSLVNFVVRV
ncbi:hypothetical protein CFC21_009442 [Triticum aestivum]|uniref:non-specific serine/threonine protein kinase n=3 Tax=Triticum TaxID=4564 RepID=A0A9R0R7I2_TRITD|nr:hypothetical protein CFC21_009442 [Triticum aestivum]VAH23775.1 unnamed protein product [Triticum turgidum subsp. durum]